MRRYRPLIISSLLVLSWCLPFMYAYWQICDRSIYFALQNYFLNTVPQRALWAWMNCRYNDIVLAVLLLAIPFWAIRKHSYHSKERSRIILGLFLSAIYIFIAWTAIRYVLRCLEIRRYSPSLVYPPKVWLSPLYPYLPIKEASSDSFPGDHTALLFLWRYAVLCYLPYLRRLTLLCVCIFALPRLVVGAHWFTDLALGSYPLATLTWCCYHLTPLHNYWNALGKRFYHYIKLQRTKE